MDSGRKVTETESVWREVDMWPDSRGWNARTTQRNVGLRPSTHNRSAEEASRMGQLVRKAVVQLAGLSSGPASPFTDHNVRLL